MSQSYTPEQLRHIVRAIAGDCPIPFSQFWDVPSLPPDPIICTWFWEVRNYGLKKGQFFTAEAIANWSSTFYPMTTPEFDYIYATILEYAEVIGDRQEGE